MIRKALGLSFMVGVVSVFAFACGDDDPAGDKYPTIDSFCVAKAQLECAAGSVGVCGVPADTCKAKRKDACLAASAQTAGRAYAPAKAEACLNLVTDAYANPTNKAKYDAYVDACQRVFAGAKTKGQPCSGAYECSGSLICDLEKTTPLCADKSAPISENSGCANSGDVCASGLYCDPASPPLCRKKRQPGEGCGNTIPCVETAYCDGSTCQALAATGAGCTVDAQCAGNFCNKDIGNKCAGRQFPSENGTCKDFGG